MLLIYIACKYTVFIQNDKIFALLFSFYTKELFDGETSLRIIHKKRRPSALGTTLFMVQHIVFRFTNRRFPTKKTTVFEMENDG